MPVRRSGLSYTSRASSCTPRTHEPLFRRTVKEAGLNPYLLEFVSIREQSSWVHREDPKRATDKAKDLVKMGVAKAALLEEGQEIRLPVSTDCLIIGGGMAGMNAALHIADQGFHALLVEKESKLGGLLNWIAAVSHDHETVPADAIANSTAARVESHPNITVYTNAKIDAVKGYIGNYTVSITADGAKKEFDVSTIIVATGMKEIEPAEQFNCGRDPRVVTQLQLEGMLKKWNKECVNRKSKIKNNDVVIINCVNSKNELHGCCAIGCHISVKNALALKACNDDVRVHILYRDLSMVREEGGELEARNPDVEAEESEEEPEPIIDFDAVFIPDSHQGAALIASQLAYHDVVDVTLLGTNLWNSPELVEIAGRYMNGAIFPSGFFIGSGYPGVEEFVSQYGSSFGQEPGLLAAMGYDTIRIVKQILHEASEQIKTRSDLRAALAERRTFGSVTGPVSFDEQRRAKRDPLLLTVSGGHFLPML